MRTRNGLSLLEVIISLAVSIILISGFVSAVTIAIRNSQFAKNQTLATKLTQEAMEKIRSYRDQNNWAIFIVNCNSLSSMGISAPTSSFVRTVACLDTSPADLNKKKIIVNVSWTDPTGTHQSEISSYFSNQSLWR